MKALGLPRVLAELLLTDQALRLLTGKRLPVRKDQWLLVVGLHPTADTEEHKEAFGGLCHVVCNAPTGGVWSGLTRRGRIFPSPSVLAPAGALGLVRGRNVRVAKGEWSYEVCWYERFEREVPWPYCVPAPAGGFDWPGRLDDFRAFVERRELDARGRYALGDEEALYRAHFPNGKIPAKSY